MWDLPSLHKHVPVPGTLIQTGGQDEVSLLYPIGGNGNPDIWNYLPGVF